MKYPCPADEGIYRTRERIGPGHGGLPKGKRDKNTEADLFRGRPRTQPRRVGGIIVVERVTTKASQVKGSPIKDVADLHLHRWVQSLLWIFVSNPI
jgi:hypothetical protein